MKNTKIIRLEVQNVKRLEAVDITPQDNVVVIGGKNAAGKTSVLDAISYAIGGKALCPAKPLREGSSKGYVRVDLGDLTVERKFSQKTGTTLTVKRKDGSALPPPGTPQGVLDEMTGALCFDPLAFLRQPPAKQVETLRALLGLDFSKMDEERANAYEERTAVNSKLKDQKGARACLRLNDRAPADLVDIGVLVGKMQAAQDHNAAICEDKVTVQGWTQEIADRRRELLRVEQQAKHMRESIKNLEGSIAERQPKIDAAVQKDVEAIEQSLCQAQGLNDLVRDNQHIASLDVRISELTAASDALSDRIEQSDAAKTQMLSEAHFPVAGLAFDEDGVTFNGIPLDQASQAEAIRVSTTMGLAANPKLRVMLIRDGSLLDEDNLALLYEMAKEQNAQIWIERVGDGDEVSVLIEDGCSVSAPSKSLVRDDNAI